MSLPVMTEIRMLVDRWLELQPDHPYVEGVSHEQNQAMVLMQLPTATEVKFYADWLLVGRKVRHGERGIRIFNRDGGLIAVFDYSQTEPLTQEN